jgi:hypothetical protein
MSGNLEVSTVFSLCMDQKVGKVFHVPNREQWLPHTFYCTEPIALRSGHPCSAVAWQVLKAVVLLSLGIQVILFRFSTV